MFFLVYWVLPVLFQETKPIQIESDIQGNDWYGILFLLFRSFSMIFLYLQYPFVILPFIFIISPFISLIILWRKLKSDSGKGDLSKQFLKLNFQFSESPRKMILNSLKNPEWKKEKEIMKAFLILLPISLYLLVVILNIARLEIVNVSESEDALGWFLEILFVYIATFIFSYQLVKSSKISYKGRFIGEQIQSKFFSSLTQIGTPIAILSILLFIAQEFDSILFIIYFFAYFFMGAFIFIVFLRIFEPISILLFLKLINWRKTHVMKEEKVKERSKEEYKREISDNTLVGCYSIISAIVTIIVVISLAIVNGILISLVSNGKNFLDLSKVAESPPFKMILLTEILTSISCIQSIIATLIIAYFFAKIIKFNTFKGFSVFLYSIILLTTTIILSLIDKDHIFFFYNIPLNLISDEGWITGAPISLEVFNFSFLSMRTAFLTAKLEGNLVLVLFSYPFIFLRSFVNFIMWGYLIAIINKRYIIKTSIKEEKFVENITYSSIVEDVSKEEFIKHTEYFITIKDVDTTKIKSEDMKVLLIDLESHNGMKVEELLKSYSNKFSSDKLYNLLKELTLIDALSWWIPEFSFIHKKAQLDGLYILYNDGRDMFFFNFRKDIKNIVDPALVSGMFSALTGFIRETTKSSDYLRTIDCGEKIVILEYSEKFPFFAAIFADSENSSLRFALKKIISEFQNNHADILEDWSGNMKYFKDDVELVNKYLSEFL